MKRKLYGVLGILFAGLLIGVGYTLSQPIPVLPFEEKVFTSNRALDEGLRVDEMEQDLKELEKVLYEVHPKVIEEDHAWLDEAFEVAYGRIKEPMFIKDFYYLIAEILAKFEDAHTMIYPKELGESYMQTELEWIEDQIYVIHSRFLKPKDRVVAINGQPIEEVYKKGQKIISAENDNARRSRFLRSVQTLSFIEACTGKQKVEKITVERAGKLIEMPIIYGMEPYTNVKKQEELEKNWVRYEIDEKRKLAIFTLKKCDYNEEYIETVTKMFAEIKESGIEHLVIDVRGNGGGNSLVCDEIIHYLPVDRYVYYGVNVRFSEESRAQRGYVRTSGTTSYAPGTKHNKKVKDLLFTGDVYVLVDTHTFSSANWMGVIFQDSHLGTVVGEPTSNNPNSYGDVLQFQLPNSQIHYQVSMKRWVRPDESRIKEDTLVPDLIVQPTLDELVEGKDVAMEKIMMILK